MMIHESDCSTLLPIVSEVLRACLQYAGYRVNSDQ